MKKILILAGAGVHCKVVDAAKELGVCAIVTDNLSKKDSPSKQIADIALDYDIFDIENIVEFCKNNNVDGVLGFCIDPAQRPAQVICEKLNLPSFGTKDQVFALTDKNTFKELCIQNQVDVIPEYFEDRLDEIEYPVIVKPVDSRGSRGIEICNNHEELLRCLPIAKNESSNGKAIIEKYMKVSQEVTITYVIKDGEPNLISIGDRYPGREEDNLSRQNICVIQPSRFSELYINNVHPKVVNMIKNLGIKNGPVFMQGFVDGNTVRMFDPGIRFPGNEYERIYKKATGINPMKSIIKYCVGGEIDDYDGKMKNSYLLNNKVAIQYMINICAGEIGKYDGIDKISKMSQVVDIQQRHFVGDIIENTGDIKHRAGEICLLCEKNVEEIKNCIIQIQNELCVEDINGNNMLISPFDVELLKLYF
jgi:carbamoylphosphate synthase large subunit